MLVDVIIRLGQNHFPPFDPYVVSVRGAVVSFHPVECMGTIVFEV